MYGAMLIGHMLGDYVLQDHNMAVNKSQPGKRGALACTLHSAIYTSSAMLCVYAVQPFENIALIYALIWMSHYVIDRWSLAKRLLQWKGFGEVNFNEPGHLFLYAANDNALHLILMFIIFGVM